MKWPKQINARVRYYADKLKRGTVKGNLNSEGRGVSGAETEQKRVNVKQK